MSTATLEPKTKAKKPKPAKLAKNDRDPAAAAVVWSETSLMSVEFFERHPANRAPTKEAIDDVAASMAAKRQLEPIKARAFAGRYQIISGETRWLAAKQLGWAMIDARVATLTDAQALEYLAEENAHRHDLTPIDKARLIEQLCLAEVSGGASLTREQAAQRVGLESASAASNLVRLLELPAKVLDLVADGTIAESKARLLLDYTRPELAPLLEKLVKSVRWKDDRDEVARSISQQVNAATRPLTKGWEYVPNFYHNWVPLKPDAATLAELQVIEVAGQDQYGAKRKKPVQRCLNVALWEQLQREAIAAAQQKEEQKATKGTKGRSSEKVTAAIAKERAKEQREQQARRVAAWRHDWLKELVAFQVDTTPALRERLLLAIALDQFNVNYASNAKGAGEEALLKEAKRLEVRSNHALAALEDLGTNSTALYECGTAFVKAFLLAPDKDPRYPTIAHDEMDDLARSAGIDLAAAWKELQTTARLKPQSLAPDLLKRFYDLFSMAQLDDLGEELGVHVGEVKGKPAKVNLFVTRDRALKLPAAIKKLAAKRKSGR